MLSCLHSRLNPALDQLFAADTARLPAAAALLRLWLTLTVALGSCGVARRIFANSRRNKLLQVRATDARRTAALLPQLLTTAQRCRAWSSVARWMLLRA